MNAPSMNTRSLRSDAILLMTAVIWGFAFTAQRAGMDHIGPYFYTATRFLLGILVLLPMWPGSMARYRSSGGASWAIILPGLLAGVFLTLGVLFQQVGIVHTTAGKAGFITGLYVVLVPIFSIAIRKRTHPGGWAGAVLAVLGLYFLSVSGTLSVARGDLFVLISAVFWAVHVLVLARFAPDLPFIPLAILQYAVCAVVAFGIAVVAEPITFGALSGAAVPILYGGAISVGVAYTLQIIGQREAPPTHAAIILSLEGAFAALGGFIVLGERLSIRELAGCGLMLAGMIVSQLTVRRRSGT